MKRATEHIYYMEGEEETDRPFLYYIHGSGKNMAVDAGNSPEHVHKFYRELKAEGLPLPDITVLTHWHWDHTFGMTAVVGTTLASTKTNAKLRAVREWKWTKEEMLRREQTGEDIPFCNECIEKEYQDPEKIQVVAAEHEIDADLTVDLGDVCCELYPRDSTHSRDALYIYIPKDRALVIGDADCEDAYENHGDYDPDRLREMDRFLRSFDADIYLVGHDHPQSKKEEWEYLDSCIRTILL
ncbi:MAG: MBL fold metallo-hydrolase [Fusicatenibacter sp.]